MTGRPTKFWAATIAVTACAAVLAVSPAEAGASTTGAWRATFAEPIGGVRYSPFDCPIDSPCSSGSGEVTGLGVAQTFTEFGACGTTCDVRTLTFGDGSTIVMAETFAFAGTPGRSDRPNPSYGHPFAGDLTDTIIGGTGRFVGASGTASGVVTVAGGTSRVKLSGTLTY